MSPDLVTSPKLPAISCTIPHSDSSPVQPADRLTLLVSNRCTISVAIADSNSTTNTSTNRIADQSANR
jgi:hypothetical protein